MAKTTKPMTASAPRQGLLEKVALDLSGGHGIETRFVAVDLAPAVALI